MNSLTDTSLRTALNYARTRAHLDAPDDFCETCIEDTPLAYNNASDMHTITYLRRVAAEVDHETVDRYGEIEVRNRVEAAYETAFWEFCAAPTDCEICTSPSEFGKCGHEEYGEPCPARSDDDV